MSTLPDGKSAPADLQFQIDTLLIEFADYLECEGICNVNNYKRYAQHFLIWLELTEFAMQTIDGELISQFLVHDCACYSAAPSSATIQQWRKRHSCTELMRFIRFLEITKRIHTHEELDSNLLLLNHFIDRVRSIGYSASSIATHRAANTRLIGWLHNYRIRLCDLTSARLEEFWSRNLICSIPGVFSGHATQCTSKNYRSCVRNFLVYLVEIGTLEPLVSTAAQQPLPGVVEQFCKWLRQHRGVTEQTIRRYLYDIPKWLPVLGENPGAYDAGMIRELFFARLQCQSRSQARRMASTMRMFLRFLAAQGEISATLIHAVPTIPKWQLSQLPRYISDADVQRTIASCTSARYGVRDRAILLLLSRLALRAGDIVALRLEDIDWDRAQVRVSGKSQRESILPLPQDVGDALYAYIADVRPKVEHHQVFVGARAPYRPFAGHGAVSSIAHKALDRAGVTTFANRGAHVFRHSQATSLLRSGASLNVVQSLLRHASADTTMIYAKTDVVMLQEIAQPWIGRLEQ